MAEADLDISDDLKTNDELLDEIVEHQEAKLSNLQNKYEYELQQNQRRLDEYERTIRELQEKLQVTDEKTSANFRQFDEERRRFDKEEKEKLSRLHQRLRDDGHQDMLQRTLLNDKVLVEEQNKRLLNDLHEARQMVASMKKGLRSADKADGAGAQDFIKSLEMTLSMETAENKKLNDEIQELHQRIKALLAASNETIEETANSEEAEVQIDHPVNSDAVSKWLKEGTVNLTVKRVQMLGPPGSGKTCSQRLLLNEDPPEEAVTSSTPIACRAVKATRISAHDDRMERVDAEALLTRLAGDLKAPRKKETQAKGSGTKSKEESSETISTNSPKTKETESANITESADATEPAGDPDANKILLDIVEAIPKAKANLNCNWVYIIDSGGQTAFQELLPLFTRPASLNIITIDLSKGFDEKLDLRYQIDGKSFSCDSEFSYSNIEFLKDVLSSGAVSQPYHDKYPGYFVLGTHSDDDKATPEKVQKYNKELLSFTSGSKTEKGYQIIPAIIDCEIIHPVNTMLKSGPDRQEISKSLCDKILIDMNSNDTFPVPVRWFAFELALLKKAGNGSCLKKHDVLSIGRSLEMKKEDTEQALLYLHNATIILYYPEVLPDIVFVDPHPILDTLSRLLALTYKIDVTCLTRKGVDIADSYDLHNLRKRGIFTESLLDMLNGDKGFSTSDFIKLLLHLHIIAKTEDDYFIPSALPSYTGTPPESDTVNPLLIVWQNPNKEMLPVPRGIFPLAVVNLMIKINKLKKEKNLQFHFSPATNQEAPKYFRYRDAMSFCIDDVNDDIQVGTIHFIKKHRHIEIHFTGHKDDALKYCPEIRKAVTEAINSSSAAINLESTHKLAFSCSSTESCYCIVTNEAKERVRCTLCPKRAIISGQEKYWTWFHVTHQSSTEVDSTSSSSSTASISQTRRETKEGTFRSDIAHRVMTECTSLIKDCGINIHFLVDKLLEHNIINAREKRGITDGYTKQTAGERMEELLDIISSSISMDGEIFGIFLDILRKEGTRRTIGLADKLMNKYKSI